MRVLVTGANGFVGSHLIPHLVYKGYDVRCLVRQEPTYREELLKDVQYILGDVTDKRSLIGCSEDIDYVVHLAAVGHVAAVTEESYKRFVSVNEEGTQNLIDEFLESKSLKKFVHFSSTAAMGRIGIPILNENSTPNPATPYQKSKRRSEIIVENAFREYGFPGVILRPCMIYGPGGYGEFYKFCKLMKKGVFPKVGRGRNLTPIVYIEDVVEAAYKALENGKIGETYIIASENSIPLDDMRNLIVGFLGVSVPYLYSPKWLTVGLVDIIARLMTIVGKEPIASKKNIISITTDRTFDISKAVHEINYKPQYSFYEGIRNTINWYKTEKAI